MGITLCGYTVIVFIFNLDRDHLDIVQYLDRMVMVVPIVFTFIGVRSISKEPDFSYRVSLQSGLFINFISFLIYTPFLLIYHHFIHPEWLTHLLKFKEAELISANASSETVKMTLEQIKKSSTVMNLVVTGLIFGVFILGSIFSLISAFILKRIG